MLKLFNCLQELDIGQLMRVYNESNEITGMEQYPNLPENLRLLYAEQDFYAYLKIFFREPTAKYAVWLSEGAYVCAVRIERYEDGLLLNALETARDKRCNGYASKLICAVLNQLHAWGEQKVYAHVEKKNTRSVTVHLRCGFQVISESAVYLDGTVHPDNCTLCYTLA